MAIGNPPVVVWIFSMQIKWPVISIPDSYMKWLVAFAIILFAALIFFYVPPNMDIFQPFHPIACAEHPDSVLHSYMEPCDGSFDLKLFGALKWTRASDYQGLAYSILYYPIYKLLPIWQSGVLMSVIWMTLGVYAFIKISKVSTLVASTIFGLNFFWVFNQLEDISPAAYQNSLLFVAPWIAVLIKKEVSLFKKLFLNVILAMLLFLGFECKFIFCYFFPSLIIILILYCTPKGFSLKSFWELFLHFWPAALLLGGFLAALLYADMPDNQPYYKMALWRNGTYHLMDYIRHLKNMVVIFLFNFPSSNIVYFAQMAQLSLVDNYRNYWEVLITLPFWLFFFFMHFKFFCDSKNIPDASVKRRQVIWLWIAGGLSIMLVSSNSWSRHSFHLLPGFSCLLASLVICVDSLKKSKRIFFEPTVLLLIISQFFCLGYVLRQDIGGHQSWDRFSALSASYEPSLANSSFVVHIDWGTYYIGALYSPRDAVHAFMPSYTNMLRKEGAVKQLRDKIHKERRRLFIIRQSNSGYPGWEEVKKQIHGITLIYPPAGQKSQWELWAEPPLDPFAKF